MRGYSALVLVIGISPSPTSGQEVLGCFHYNYGYVDVKQDMSGSILNSTAECQTRCAGTDGCLGFTYYTGPKSCDLTFTAANLQPTTPAMVGISGPPRCSSAPNPDVACSASPSAAFPGKTAAESNAAFPGGTQPTNAQCWPRDPQTGIPVLCSPMNITVLEDTKTKWPGSCLGLKQMSVPEGLSCEQYCLQNPLCSVWSEVNSTSPPQCWQGVFGGDCYSGGTIPTSAQRVMHGTYRVLKNLKGMQVMGLTNMFDANLFSDAVEGPAHCRLYCIAALACNYWQYSSISGCWVEDPANGKVAYPLVLSEDVANTDTSAAMAITDGEYIQHLCAAPQPPSTPPPLTTTSSVVAQMSQPRPMAIITTTAAPSSLFPWWVWLLGLLACLLCGGVVAGAILYLRRKPKTIKRSAPQFDESKMSDYTSYQSPHHHDAERVPLNQEDFRTSVPPSPQQQYAYINEARGPPTPPQALDRLAHVPQTTPAVPAVQYTPAQPQYQLPVQYAAPRNVQVLPTQQALPMQALPTQQAMPGTYATPGARTYQPAGETVAQQAARVFDQLDSNGDGVVSRAEFARLMR